MMYIYICVCVEIYIHDITCESYSLQSLCAIVNQLSIVPQDRKPHTEVIHHELRQISTDFHRFPQFVFHTCPRCETWPSFGICSFRGSDATLNHTQQENGPTPACKVLNFHDTAKEMIQMVKKLITAIVTAVTRVTPHLRCWKPPVRSPQVGVDSPVSVPPEART